MTNQRTYADAFTSVFTEEKAFLDFLRERDDRGDWTKRHTRDLRILPLERENTPEAESLPGYTQDDLRAILADTMENTRLLLKSKDLVVPIRNCALKTLLERAKISGPALNRLEKPVLARILNHCLRIASGEALLRISDGKLSAVHGGDSSDYAVLEMPELFNRTIRYLNDHFSGCSFAGGFYDHSTATAVWELADETLVQSYQNALEQHDVPYGPLKPAIRLSTSDVGVSGANLYPTLYTGGREATIVLGSPLKLEHRGEKTIKDFERLLDMLYSQYQFAIGNLARLLDIEIGNPINCMLGICKRIGISKKLAYEATEQFKAQNGDEPCTAHDIYYGMSEIVFMVACGGASGTIIVQAEETIARALSVRWQEYDIPGNFKW